MLSRSAPIRASLGRGMRRYRRSVQRSQGAPSAGACCAEDAVPDCVCKSPYGVPPPSKRPCAHNCIMLLVPPYPPMLPAASTRSPLHALAHGVLPGPLPGGLLIPPAVGLVDVRDFRHKGVVGVGVCEQGADRQQHLQAGTRANRGVQSTGRKVRTARSIDVVMMDRRGQRAHTQHSQGRPCHAY